MINCADCIADGTHHRFEVRSAPREEIMQKFGLIAATVVAFSLGSVEAWAQLQPLSGPAYEKAVCGCRITAKGTNRWPDCMARRGYYEMVPGGKNRNIPATAGDWVVCKKKG
jgi:hypothetical protein